MRLATYTRRVPGGWRGRPLLEGLALFDRLRALLRPGIIATVAAVVAITATGSAVAASLITGKDVKNGSLTGADVKNGSLSGRDLSEKARDRLRGQKGAKGDTGPAGAKGDKGDKGDTGASSETRIKSLPSGGFEATNSTVSVTPNGVKFGPYANGGAAGGSLCYDGFNGRTLSDVSTLIYRASYTTDDDNTVGVPYLRIFLEGDPEDRVIFSPNTQPIPATAEGVEQEWVVHEGTVRYNDDAGNNPDEPWLDVKADHADEEISAICVSTGFSGGANLSALLRSMDINGSRVVFGS
jgi:hypothetical protein